MSIRTLLATQKPGRYRTPTPTLFLNVSRGGKSWVQQLRIDGRRVNIGLGSCDLVTYTQASKRAIENRVAAFQGRNPARESADAKRQAAVPTFSEAVKATFQTLRGRWKTDTPAKAWISVLANYAEPRFGHKRVDDVTQADVLAVVTSLHAGTPAQARRLRHCIRQVLGWCEAHGHVTRNVAGDAIKGALPKQRAAAVKHHDALPHRSIAGVFDALSRHKNRAVGMVLRWIILTAVRGGEARGARWAEIDREARTWTIPADRMKTGVEHRVPLSDAAMALLDEAREIADGSGLVFPSPFRQGGMVAVMLVRKALRSATDEPCSVHGLRSTFRMWAADRAEDRELAEATLAHVVKGVEGSYQRSDIIERRRRLMGRWGQYVTGQRGQVVSLADAI